MEPYCSLYINMTLISLPINSKIATKCLMELILESIWPLVTQIRNQLLKQDNIENEVIIKDIFSLCCSQVKKSLECLFFVLKLENKQQILLQESRYCLIERLSWCINKLHSIDSILKKIKEKNFKMEDCDESLLTVPTYFVNWVDHTFEILTKLSDIVYNEHNDEYMCSKWKDEMVECVGELHVTLDELLLSAMTLCKYCLPDDQNVINTRCQVVLREAKSLICEIVDGDINSSYNVTKESLKLPLMPSNVNVLIDVLKDVLYALEANVNTALLSLLIHLFSYRSCPVKTLKDHLVNSYKGVCACEKDKDEEDCNFIKEFDLYNERLLQIGSFAVSCSADQSRILSLRSGLASVEALDPHLVPALMTLPLGQHAQILADSWIQEVNEIRDNVFLIVDPLAFTERIKQMMHRTIIQVIEENKYNNSQVCSVIDLAVALYDLFGVYQKYEPDALVQTESLTGLLNDLCKVISECKIVNNLLSKGDDFLYDVKVKNKAKEVSFQQVLKRIKLLYHLVNKINELYKPKENEEHIFENGNFEEPMIDDATRTLYKNKVEMDVNSPKKTVNNITKSVFARSTYVKSHSNLALARLTNHLSSKRNEKLSFSINFNNLFNFTASNIDIDTRNNDLTSKKQQSILYKFDRKNRTSLRKAVLNKNRSKNVDVTGNCVECVGSGNDDTYGDATSLQITEILDQMSDISNVLATTKQHTGSKNKFGTPKSVLKLNINKEKTPLAKQIWNIPINTTVDISFDETRDVSSTSSVPSDVTTSERINDLDAVDCRLSNLKLLSKETRL